MKLLIATLFLFTLLPPEIDSSQCSAPDSIAHGYMTYTGIDSGDTVTYRCRVGFVITNGTETRTCNDSGSWNGTLPTCTDMDDVFTFACDQNGTITAINPDPTTLIWVNASNEDGLCSTVFDAGNISVTITTCAIDKAINLVFSPYSDGIPTLITDKLQFYNLTCNSIPIDGINVMVTDNTWVRNLMSTSQEPPRTPVVIINTDIVGVSSSIEGDNTTADNITLNQSNFTEIAINQKLTWRVELPAPYIVWPLNCTAYSGEIDEAGSRHVLDVISMGCTLDISLLTDFVHEDPLVKNSAVTDLYAFRFPGSSVVEIVCSVKACPPGSTQCDFSCGGRKRRSMPYKSNLDSYSDYEAEGNDSRQRRSIGREGDLKTTRVFFRVIGPPNVGLEYLKLMPSWSGGLRLVTQWSVTMAFTFLVMVMKTNF